MENMLSCDSVADSAIMGSKRKNNKAIHFRHLAGEKTKMIILKIIIILKKRKMELN